jgi:hypothetical protein
VDEDPGIEVPVEIDETGLSTGVELEQLDDVIDEPFDPAKIDVLTRTMTVDLLLARLRRGVLDIAPDFQRYAGIWSEENQSKLIESLLLRIPLPHIYAAESGEESWAVVDGIQRLTTIARFVEPSLVDADPLKLRKLEYLRQYEGLRYPELSGAMQTRINETELIVHLIRAGTPEPVKFNIFARINTGGLSLSRQELRHALIPGPARNILKSLAESEEFLKATRRSVRPHRMADREMVLRFLAFSLTAPEHYSRGDLDEFLREAMQRLNTLPVVELGRLGENFAAAMDAARRIFVEHAFRKRYRGQSARLPINKALFEAISVNLSVLDVSQIVRLMRRRDTIQESFMILMEDLKFQQSISGGTGDVQKVRTRFGSIKELFDGVLR